MARPSTALLSLLIAGATARAAPPATVAVVPFADLTSSRRAVGEAICETVTSDLRAVPGLRVVERARLDQLLDEQRLQGDAIDVPRAVQLGRLAGATLIVTGAYQRVGEQVRLTARFVRVETGEIVGTAKVDGAEASFLSLQDRVTSELARSAGFVLPPRRRAPLRRPRVIERYGDALLARDDEQRRALLRAAVSDEPQFDYAVHDLDAVERRLQERLSEHEREHDRIGAQRVEKLAARVATSREPAERVEAWEALWNELHAQLRFRRLLDEADRAVAHPPLPPSTPLGARLDERARFEQILTRCIFKRDADRVLRDGERLLAAYPGSRHFEEVRRFLEYAMRWKRKAAEGAGSAAARLARLAPEQRADPCLVAHIYHEERQLREATASYERCVADPRADQSHLMNLVNAYIAIPDFPSARRALTLLRARFPGLAEGPQGQGWREIPIDG